MTTITISSQQILQLDKLNNQYTLIPNSASPTYNCDVIVFHKTRISENDLVLDMISSDGDIVRGVAKSARKPGNTFSNRLDLFNVAHICLAKTKSIDIVREAKLLKHFDIIRADFHNFAAASSVCEILWRLTFYGEANSILYDFLYKTLLHINSYPNLYRLLTVASCFKLFSLEGFRPNLINCSECGHKFNEHVEKICFSPASGGVVCNNCASADQCFYVSHTTINLIDWLISSTYEQIEENHNIVGKRVYEIGKVLRQWTQFYLGHSFRSLNFALH